MHVRRYLMFICVVLGMQQPAVCAAAQPSVLNVVDAKVGAASDDGEEAEADGRTYLDSSDLELADDADYLGKQTIGVRFPNVGLPPRATIIKAWLQFTAKSVDDGTARLAIRAELSPVSPAFSSWNFDISRRKQTASAVTWTPDPWTRTGEAGNAERTPDLAVLVQEAVLQVDWTTESALTFILSGSGRRTAHTFDGTAEGAPRLHIEYALAAPSHPPVAMPDVARTDEGMPIDISVRSNDSDPDGDAVAIAGTSLPEHGRAEITNGGIITYTPDKWFSGIDAFNYTISDGHGGVATTTVKVSVTPSPNAVDDVAIALSGAPVEINLLENDGVVGGSALSIAWLGSPAHGRASLSGNGAVLYTPDQGFTGTDGFVYDVTDKAGRRSQATVTVHTGSGFGEVRFAVIGDFGTGNGDAEAVSKLIGKLGPEFIVTVGDNVYGSDLSPDKAVGQFYSSFIGNYRGLHGAGSSANRFFPVLGNHDWRDLGLDNYLAYFDFPRSTSGNRRYYDFVKGPVHFFMIDSDELELDGTSVNSIQAQWLKRELARSVTPFQVVVMHEPPFSSGGEYGGAAALQWPFEEWGADAVLSGHEHIYERILKDHDGDGRTIPYIVNGAGGAKLYEFKRTMEPGSAFRHSGFGAMIVTATDDELALEFWSTDGNGTLLDRYALKR